MFETQNMSAQQPWLWRQNNVFNEGSGIPDNKIAGLTAKDRKDWELEYADAIADKRAQGKSDEYIDRLYYNSKYKEIFGQDNLKKYSKEERDQQLSEYMAVKRNVSYTPTDFDDAMHFSQVKQNTPLTKTYVSDEDKENSKIKSALKTQEEERKNQLSGEVIDYEKKLEKDLQQYNLGFDDVYNISENIKKNSTQYFENNSDIETIIKNITGKEPVKKQSINAADPFSYVDTDNPQVPDSLMFEQAEKNLKELVYGDDDENTSWKPVDQMLKEEDEKNKKFIDKLAQNRQDYIRRKQKEKEEFNLKFSILNNMLDVDNRFNFNLDDENFEKTYSKTKQQAAEEVVTKGVTDGSFKKLNKQIKSIAETYSGYYREFKNHDRCNFGEEVWTDIAIDYHVAKLTKGESEAVKYLNLRIQEEAAKRETFWEKFSNGFQQMGADIAGSLVTAGGVLYGTGNYLFGDYENIDGLSGWENYLTAIMDNDISNYGNNIVTTGSMYTEDQKRLLENGVNRTMITNPHNEISWGTTPFEILGQHGFSVASMILSFGMSGIAKQAGRQAFGLVKNIGRATNHISPIKCQRVLSTAAKIGLSVETGFNGVLTPLFVGLPEAIMNGVDSRQQVLDYAKDEHDVKYNTLFNDTFQLNYQLMYDNLFQQKLDELMQDSQNWSETGFNVDVQALHSEVFDEIYAKTMKDIMANSREYEINKQIEFQAAKAGVHAFTASAIINGSTNGLLKTTMLAPSARASMDKIKRSIGFKSGDKFKTSTKLTPSGSTYTAVRAKGTGHYFKNKFGDTNKTAIFLDNVHLATKNKVKEAIGEGLEEYGQGIGQDVSESVANFNITEFINNKYYGNANAALFSFQANTASTALTALSESLVSSENIHAGILGALSVLVPGRPGGPRRATNNTIDEYETDLNGNIIKDENGNPIKKKFWRNIPSKTKRGIINALFTQSAEIQEMTTAAAAIQETINSEEFKAKFEGVVGAIEFAKQMQQSAEEDDQFSFRNSRLGMNISMANTLAKLEGTEYYNNIMQHLQDVSNIDIAVDENDNPMSAEAQKIIEQIKTNDNYRDDYLGQSNKEILEQVQKNAVNFLEQTKKIIERSKKIDREFGYELDDDVKRSIIWGELSIANLEERSKGIQEKLQDVLDRTRQNLRTTESNIDVENPNISNKDKKAIIKFGSVEEIQKQKNKIYKQIQKLEEELDQIKKDRNPTKAVRENFTNKSNQLKELKKSAKNIEELLSKEAQESDYVFTAEEILNLDPVSRGMMIDPRRLSKRSKRQQEEINRLMKAMSLADQQTNSTNSWKDFIDLSKIEIAKSDFANQYNMIRQDSKLFNEYFRRAKMDSYEFTINAQVSNIESATTYEDYVARLKMALMDEDENPLAKYRNIKLMSKLNDKNPFLERYRKNIDFKNDFGHYNITKAAGDRGSNENIDLKEAILLEQICTYLTDVGNIDVYNILDNLDKAKNILADGGFITFLQQSVSEEIVEFAESMTIDQLMNFFEKAVSEYINAENSKLKNQVIQPVVDRTVETEKSDNKRTDSVVEPQTQEEIENNKKLLEKGQKDLQKLKEFIKGYNRIFSNAKSVILRELDNFEKQIENIDVQENYIDAFIKYCLDEQPHMASALIVLQQTFSSSENKNPNKQNRDIVETNPRSSNIELFFTNKVISDLFGENYARMFNIEEFLSKHKINKDIKIQFVSFLPINSKNYDSTSDSPVLAVIEHNEGKIEIDGKRYQPIGLLPSNKNENMQGSAQTSYIRQAAINSSTKEFVLVKGIETTIDTASVIPSSVATNTKSYTSLDVFFRESYPADEGPQNRRRALVKNGIVQQLVNRLKFNKDNTELYYETNSGVEERVFNTVVKKSDVEYILDKLNEQELNLETPYIHGAHQDIVTAAARWQNHFKKFEDQLTSIEESDFKTLENDILKMFYFPKNTKFKLVSSDGTNVKIAIIINKTIHEFTTTIDAKGFVNLFDQIIEKGIEIQNKNDYKYIQEQLNKYRDGNETISENSEIVKMLDRMLNRSVYINVDPFAPNAQPTKILIRSPFNAKERQQQSDTFGLGDAYAVATGSKNDKTDQKPLTTEQKVTTIENIVKQTEVPVEERIIDDDGISRSAKSGTRVGASKLANPIEDESDVNKNTPLAIGNSVDMLIKDLLDNNLQKSYPNMTDEEVEKIANSVTKALTGYLSGGWTFISGGLTSNNTERLVTESTFDINVKTEQGTVVEKLPMVGKFDFLMYNKKTGKVIIVDVKTLRSSNNSNNLNDAKRKSYSNQLEVYKYLLSKQVDTETGNQIQLEDIETKILVVPMNYPVDSNSEYATDPSNTDAHEKDQLYYKGKPYTGATLMGNASLEGTRPDSIDKIIDKYIQHNKEEVSRLIVSQQARQEQHNQEGADSQMPVSPITEDSKISTKPIDEAGDQNIEEEVNEIEEDQGSKSSYDNWIDYTGKNNKSESEFISEDEYDNDNLLKDILDDVWDNQPHSINESDLNCP